MDKYEKRRRRLTKLRDEMCGGKAAELARRIGREPSYVSRMLYPEGKAGKKRIADDMMEVIESAFKLPRGWLDQINDLDIAEAQKALNPTPEEEELVRLFRSLPSEEAQRFIDDMRKAKIHYDAIFEEMLKKRSLS